MPGAVGLTQTNVREGQGKLRAPSSTTQGQVSQTEGKASIVTLQGVTQRAAGEFVPKTPDAPRAAPALAQKCKNNPMVTCTVPTDSLGEGT